MLGVLITHPEEPFAAKSGKLDDLAFGFTDWTKPFVSHRVGFLTGPRFLGHSIPSN
jgi:hypothetical protein